MFECRTCHTAGSAPATAGVLGHGNQSLDAEIHQVCDNSNAREGERSKTKS